ncbi:MAG TPA: hypothetical protein VFB33_04695, partial [Candidatus Binataceae bacterium]|nr:hypothetical protein [Candidatus Binataceae bacterium]
MNRRRFFSSFGSASRSSVSVCFASSIFQKVTIVLASPFRIDPPSWFAWRIVSQKGDTNFDAESKKWLMPRYGFLVIRLRGNPVEVHGRRHG